MNKYKARPSSGWLWLMVIGLVTLSVTIIPMLFVFQESPSWVWLMNISLGLLISIPFIFIALQIRQIVYIFHADYLEISMGRLIKYKIQFSEINEVVKKNLTITLWSSMRLPGLALFKVLYADEGVVSMCATSAANDIILIRTTHGKYGITPVAENEFIKLLTSKIR